MKRISQISLGLTAFVLALALSACKKDKYTEPAVSFTVTKTEVPYAYTGGDGFIEVSEADFTIVSEAEWITAQLESPKRVKVTLAKNENAEARTANVRLIKGNTVQRVPITQSGVINEIVASDIYLGRQGGEYLISRKGMESEPKVTASENWVDYKITDDAIIIRVGSIASQSEERTAKVSIRVGLALKNITVSQTYSPTYTELLGEYTFSYQVKVGSPRRTTVVRLEEHEKDKSYRLSGLAGDVIVGWNAKGSTLSLASQLLTGQTWLCAWLAGEDGKGQLRNSTAFVFVAPWGGDINNPNFTFSCTNSKDFVVDQVTYTPKGMIFWTLQTGEYKADTQLSRIVNFSMRKN